MHPFFYYEWVNSYNYNYKEPFVFVANLHHLLLSYNLLVDFTEDSITILVILLFYIMMLVSCIEMSSAERVRFP